MMSDRGNEGTESKPYVFESTDKLYDTSVGPFMRNLFAKQLYTDVTFYSSSKKTDSVSAHRAVLAGKSEFFENLLFGEQKNEAVGMEMMVQISNVPFSVFTSIVKYFYTDDIEFTDDNTVFELYAAAQSFQIEELVDRCKIYIRAIEVTEDNVCSILQVCNSKHVDELKNRCIKYIEKNSSQVISSTDFEKCSFSTVREICQLQTLSLSSEMELLKAVLRWMNTQPKHVKKELTRTLLKCIRFLSFTPKEFSDIIQKHPDLLAPEDGLKILIHLNNPKAENLNSLPNWCNKNLRSHKADQKEILKGEMPQRFKEGSIKISLKPTDSRQNMLNLTSVLHIKCQSDVLRVKSLKFSFDAIRNDGSLLANLFVNVRISPDGPAFHKTHTVYSVTSALTFAKSIKVYRGQVLRFEATAKVTRSCRFLRFVDWSKEPEGDFQCFFISKPKLGEELYFISEVEYEFLPK